MRQALSVAIASEITASDPTLIPAVQSNVLEKLLTAQTVDINSIADIEYRKVLYEYFKPLVQKLSEEITTETGTTDATVEELKFDLGINPADIVTFKFSPSMKNTLERKYGLITKKSSDSSFYAPHQIQVYNLNSISDTSTLDLVSKAFVQQGGDTNMVPDTPVLSNFVDTRFSSFISEDHLTSFSGLLPGMAFCFFGAEIPKGYIEANGNGSWPNAAWVPPGLRQQPLPSGQDMLLGITLNRDEAGKIWDKGTLVFQEFPLEIRDLKVESLPSGGLHALLYTQRPFSNNTVSVQESSAGAVSANLGLVPEAARAGGSASVKVPSVPVGSDASPPQLRCRLIIKS